MRLSAPGVRIADVETCDFGLMPRYDTSELLRASRSADAERCLRSAMSRRMIAELGVEHRHLTHMPGTPPVANRLTAFDLARSAVTRLRARRGRELARLDALIFVSTSNPNPCNSQAALLAGELGMSGSCMDLKAGCSGGVLGLMHAALLIRAGCERVLVVMAETLSQFTSPDDLRMLLTVGDGGACVLVERAPGSGFLAMIHGTHAELADAMTVRTPFPPATADARYVYEFSDTRDTAAFLHTQWRAVFAETLTAAGIERVDLAYALVHQTHVAQLRGLAADLGLEATRMPMVVDGHGNMGTPTFAVALARTHASLLPGQRYLLQAVGGGVSWCGIVAEHAL
jgi:3-oxoacyl-[acyl-carrier-protein] synthase III